MLIFNSQKDPSKYFLCIADDDGQDEEDFPPLTHARPIGQYDFPHLTLIEQIVSISTSTILSKSDQNQSDVDNDNDDDDDQSFDDSSRSITPPLNERRRSNSSSDKPSSVLALQEFQTQLDPIDKLNRLYDSLNQKTYFFDYYLKEGSNKHVKIRLDVSGEQIRFELLEKTSRLNWQNMLLTTQRLIDCTLLNKETNKKKGYKKKNKKINKLIIFVFYIDRTRIYLRFECQPESDGTRNYQTYDLESTVEIAEQFRDQILNIIKLKNPQGRDIYEQQQQRRDNTRKRRSIFNIIAGGGGGSSSGGNSGSAAKS